MHAIAELRRKSFRYTQHQSIDALAAYLRSVFFDNPWRVSEPSSLVWEGDAGNVLGFLGVIARQMTFGGAPIVSATLSTFMVDAEQRGQGIGRQLMQRYLDGSQDFAFSDVANPSTRDLWFALGGDIARLHNLYWTRGLRALRSASVQWIGGRTGYLASVAARPIAAIVDPIVARIPGTPQYIVEPPGRLEVLPAHLVDEGIDRFTAEYAIRPVYPSGTFEWLSAQLAEKPSGRLHSALVRDASGRAAGWFVYFINPRGTAQVVQIAAENRDAGLVLDHLVYHAWKSGVVTLAGRVDPHLLQAMSTRGFNIARDDPWVMIHSRRPELLAAIHRGDAYLSRLEGEWWMVA